MSKMASKSNFGKFFGISSSKNKKKYQYRAVSKSSKTKDDESEDESYEDPTNSFPTEAPISQVHTQSSISKPVMPDYPPPRLDVGAKKRDDYADPYDSKDNQNGVSSPPPVYNHNISGNYADPFDAKFSVEQNRIKENITNNGNSTDDDDGYDSPYETSKTVTSLNVVKSSVRNIVKQDEYSDPWDSKNSSSPKSQDASFDDTYSEPYDNKGHHMDIRITSTLLNEKKVEDVSVDDEIGEFSDKEKRWIGVSKESPIKKDSCNTPNQGTEEEPTCQGDYDAPWDWKIKKMEKEFNDVCKVGSTDIDMDSKETSVSIHNDVVKRERSIEKHVEKNEVADSNDPTKAYEVDPTIPLQNQAWFHGRIRRGDAENLLKAEPDCSYLIRNSESSKIDFSLSIRNNGDTIHLKISCKDSKYILGVNSRPFDTIPEMIHFYSMNKLNIRGAEQVKLQYPVLQEAVYFTVMPGT